MSDAKKSTTTTKKAEETAGKSQTQADLQTAIASTEFVEAQERGYFGELPKERNDGK